MDRHRRDRLAWFKGRQISWNLRTWRHIHSGKESRFLLYVTYGWERVWRHRFTAYSHRNHCTKSSLLWRATYGVGLYLDWMQDGSGDSQWQPNRQKIHPGRAKTWICASFWQLIAISQPQLWRTMLYFIDIGQLGQIKRTKVLIISPCLQVVAISNR